MELGGAAVRILVNPRSDDQPEVSVVMPARDAAGFVEAQLDALAAQDFEGSWELVVVDDGSTDGTPDVVARWNERLPCLTLLSLAQSRGQSHAYNLGARNARAAVVAFCDADDIVSSSWIRSLAGAIDENPIVTGPFDLARLNPDKLYRWRRGPPVLGRPTLWHGYLLAVNNANIAVRRALFEEVGGFDESLATGEDYDFGFRVQLAGATVGYAFGALVHYRLREGWPYFRRVYEYGRGHANLYLRFRDFGMRRRPVRGALRVLAAVVGIPIVVVPRYRYGWLTLAGTEAGRLAGSLGARTLFL
jgi:glycosyltransferase involved in cell wall biosynthesis